MQSSIQEVNMGLRGLVAQNLQHRTIVIPKSKIPRSHENKRPGDRSLHFETLNHLHSQPLIAFRNPTLLGKLAIRFARLFPLPKSQPMKQNKNFPKRLPFA